MTKQPIQPRTSADVIMAVLLLSMVVWMAGCSNQDQNTDSPVIASTRVAPAGVTRPVAAEDLKIVTGQRLYVPAYSEIFNSNGRTTYQLTVMLSVRNTDADAPIVIRSIQYYDTAGTLVREYLESPQELAPMASTEVVISEFEGHGGSGANFIVEWGAEERVHEPIVEALMTSTSAQQGISFLSTARVLEETP